MSDMQVEVYSAEHKATICVRNLPEKTTVLDFNLREDAVGVTYRKAVLLSNNFDEVLKVQNDLRSGDKLMLKSLFYVLKLPDALTACLGYDFIKNKPRITLYLA